MTRIVPLAEVFQMRAGNTVDAVVGCVVDIWKERTGTNGNGTWCLQNLMLQDEQGTEIKVQLKNRDPLVPNDWKGQWVYIATPEGNSKGGVKAHDDDYKPQHPERILVVTRSAIFQVYDPSGQQAAPPPPPPRQSAPPPPPPRQTQPTRQAPPPPQNGNGNGNGNGHRSPPPPPRANGSAPTAPVNPVKFCRERLGRATNALLMCFDAAAYIRDQVKEKHGIELVSSEVEAIAVHLNITLSKEGVDQNLPTGLVKEEPAPAETQ